MLGEELHGFSGDNVMRAHVGQTVFIQDPLNVLSCLPPIA